jgi:hypothetical protein
MDRGARPLCPRRRPPQGGKPWRRTSSWQTSRTKGSSQLCPHPFREHVIVQVLASETRLDHRGEAPDRFPRSRDVASAASPALRRPRLTLSPMTARRRFLPCGSIRYIRLAPTPRPMSSVAAGFIDSLLSAVPPQRDPRAGDASSGCRRPVLRSDDTTRPAMARKSATPKRSVHVCPFQCSTTAGPSVGQISKSIGLEQGARLARPPPRGSRRGLRLGGGGSQLMADSADPSRSRRRHNVAPAPRCRGRSVRAPG